MKTNFDFNDVIDRAKKALKINKDCDIAERLGMKAGAFNARKKSNSLPYEELLILANAEKIDFNWLLTGEGDMHKGKAAPLAMNRREMMLVELFRALDDTEQQEILSDAQKAKHLKDHLMELTEKVARLEQKSEAA